MAKETADVIEDFEMGEMIWVGLEVNHKYPERWRGI